MLVETIDTKWPGCSDNLLAAEQLWVVAYLPPLLESMGMGQCADLPVNIG